MSDLVAEIVGWVVHLVLACALGALLLWLAWQTPWALAYFGVPIW